MSLEKFLSKVKVDFLPTNRKRLEEYVQQYELKDYFSSDVDPKYQENFRLGLERITNDVVCKYDSELRSLIRTPVAKGTMALAVLNDLAAYVTATPFSGVAKFGFDLFLGKTATEIAAMRRYTNKSGDYGAYGRHLLLKVPRYLLPIIGPALESGAFERMVKRRIRKEITLRFREQYGTPLEDRLNNKMRESLRDNAYVEKVAA